MYQENQHNRSHSLLIKIISLIKSTLMMDHMIALAIWWTWPSRRVRGVEQSRESKRLSPTHRASFCNQKLLAEKLNCTNNHALNIHLHLSSFQMHSLSTLHWVSLFLGLHSIHPIHKMNQIHQSTQFSWFTIYPTPQPEIKILLGSNRSSLRHHYWSTAVWSLQYHCNWEQLEQHVRT